MGSTWGLAIMLWSALLIGVTVLLIWDARKTPEQKKKEDELTRGRYEKERLSHQIVAVTPLGVTGKRYKRGGLRGALKGGFLGGLGGALSGAVLRLGKPVSLVSFFVKYADGRVEIRTCAEGSAQHKTFAKYIPK